MSGTKTIADVVREQSSFAALFRATPDVAWVEVPMSLADQKDAIASTTTEGRTVISESVWYAAMRDGREVWLKLVMLEPMGVM